VRKDKKKLYESPAGADERCHRTSRFVLRFSLKHLAAVVTVVAVYLGVLAGTARLVSLSTTFMYSVWATEFVRLPVYILWMIAALAVFERRSESAASAKCALFALLGFGSASLVNAVMHMCFLASSTAGGPKAATATFWLAWNLAYPLLNAAFWGLLLFALLNAMKRTLP
jgi:hypothetical protein